MLRYLALLGKVQIIQVQDDMSGNDDIQSEIPNEGKWSLLGFLRTLVDAAVASAPADDAFAAANSSNAAASLVLVYFVLSTIPYLLSFIAVDVIQEQLLDPLQGLLNTYASTFTPGVGMTAILLKEEQDEGGEEEDDDEDDDDDEEGESSEVVCDSLQDLYRSVQLMMKQRQGSDGSAAFRFALLSDEPWKGISGPPAPAPGDHEEMNTGIESKPEEVAAPEEAGPLTNPSGALRLPAPEGGFKSLALLSGISDTGIDENGGTGEHKPKVQAFPLEVVVFGRLPIFGSPREEGAEEDNDDMDEEDAPANEQVAAYGKEYGIVDRCLLADAIRDVLCCHESSVSEIGQEKGSAKSVAEQIWSIGQVLPPPANREEFSEFSTTNPAGLEYGILETMFSLILQASSNSTFRQIFLCRVLLELTRLQPTQISPALALAISNLVEHYIPALVPTARRNLSSWLSFHLTNTDYQWPAAYWSHWQSYAGADGQQIQSRGNFVKSTLTMLRENVSNPGVLVNECLPKECQRLVELIVDPVPSKDEADNNETVACIEKDIRQRIWDNNEHPDSFKGYIDGDELSEALAGSELASSPSKSWCRSGLVLKSLLQPLEREHERILTLIDKAQQKNQDDNKEEADNAMDEDEDMFEDSLAVTLENLTKYGPVLAAAIAKDKEGAHGSNDSEGSLLASCEPYLLKILETKAGFSTAILEGCLDCLIQQAEMFGGMGVLRWALGDLFVDPSLVSPVDQWYEYAVDAIQLELAEKLASKGAPAAESGGMVIDRSGESGIDIDNGIEQNSSATLSVIESATPLLDYVVRRACTLLVAQADASPQGNKLNAKQVDLIEGVKTCVRSTHGLFFSLMRKSNENEKGIPEYEIKDCLSQSSLTGPKLARICEEFSDGHAVSTLRASLATA